MKKLLPALSMVGLGLTIVPPAIHLFAELALKTTFNLMTAGMIVWYLAATPWLGRRDLRPSDTEVQI